MGELHALKEECKVKPILKETAKMHYESELKQEIYSFYIFNLCSLFNFLKLIYSTLVNDRSLYGSAYLKLKLNAHS